MGYEAKTLTAFDLLQRDILNGEFAPGQALRMAALGLRYQVSATPLREALSRLAEKRLVVAAPNCGWRVAPVSLAEFEDLQAARLAIEQSLLNDAMARGGLDWEAGIVAAHYKLAQIAPPLGAADHLAQRQIWIAAHDGFHAALLAAAASDWLKGFHAQLLDQLRRHHQAVLFLATEAQAAQVKALVQSALSVARHSELRDAVLARDVAQAGAALQDHIAQAKAIYHGILGADAPAKKGQAT